MNPTDRKWLRSPSERVGTLSHADLPPPAFVPYDEEQTLLRALHGRDEAAFEWLLDRYYSAMLRLAHTYVRSSEEAEEVVQDTWLAVLTGLVGFERRSSLKTWIFRILVNRARSRAKREARQTPFSSLRPPAGAAHWEGDGSAPEWLFAGGASTSRFWHGEAWAPPRPDEVVLSDELRGRIEEAIRSLPRRQQAVVTLRDVEGWSPEEVCELLAISEVNQRVLLHRARLKIRDRLAEYFAPPEAPVPSAAS